MNGTARERSARWRDRRRTGALAITVDIMPTHRHALEAMGLIARGNENNREAIGWAVARFMDTAAAVASIGAALYPSVDDFFDDDESDVSPQNNGENEE